MWELAGETKHHWAKLILLNVLQVNNTCKCVLLIAWRQYIFLVVHKVFSKASFVTGIWIWADFKIMSNLFAAMTCKKAERGLNHMKTTWQIYKVIPCTFVGKSFWTTRAFFETYWHWRIVYLTFLILSIFLIYLSRLTNWKVWGN